MTAEQQGRGVHMHTETSTETSSFPLKPEVGNYIRWIVGGIVLAMVYAAGVLRTHDTKITENCKDIESLKSMDAIINRQREDLKKDIIDRLDRIEAKVDRKR
jgi:hypothetical protein